MSLRAARLAGAAAIAAGGLGSLLALGPVFGIWSMLRLKSLPESARMAGGRG